jgi:hypothetical protein
MINISCLIMTVVKIGKSIMDEITHQSIPKRISRVRLDLMNTILLGRHRLILLNYQKLSFAITCDDGKAI